MHNRPIQVRCDDSVVRLLTNRTGPENRASDPQAGLLPIRRSRGYAPFPVRTAWKLPPILGAGAELKNVFCLTRDHYAFLSHHIGDLENFETLQSYETGIAHFERLFRITPEVLAYDLHPDYLASRYALERAQKDQLLAVGVQHHHAHIVACMAENGLDAAETTIGVAFDGTGYGTDGAIWGGEFLLSNYHTFQRVAHLSYVPLPGGDLAVREPWRLTLAYLYQAGIEWTPDLRPVTFGRQALAAIPGDLDVLAHQIASGVNAPLTSSMGRLFDAVASLVGLRQTVNYEAQAAIELEALAAAVGMDGPARPYLFELQTAVPDTGAIKIDSAPVFQSILEDLRLGRSAGLIAAKFHAGVARMVLDVCKIIRQRTGCEQVALSGGVWQNVTLLKQTLELLEADRFKVFTHHQAPPNDGGLALGQALAAFHMLRMNVTGAKGVSQ